MKLAHCQPSCSLVSNYDLGKRMPKWWACTRTKLWYSEGISLHSFASSLSHTQTVALVFFSSKSWPTRLGLLQINCLSNRSRKLQQMTVWIVMGKWKNHFFQEPYWFVLSQTGNRFFPIKQKQTHTNVPPTGLPTSKVLDITFAHKDQTYHF